MNASSPIAQRVDLVINQGATFRTSMLVNGPSGTPIDFTNCTAIMQIRQMRSGTEIIALNTSTNGGLILGGVAGTIGITLTPAQTASFPVSSSITVGQAATFVYNIVITFASGDVFEYVLGLVSVTPAISA